MHFQISRALAMTRFSLRGSGRNVIGVTSEIFVFVTTSTLSARGRRSLSKSPLLRTAMAYRSIWSRSISSGAILFADVLKSTTWTHLSPDSSRLISTKSIRPLRAGIPGAIGTRNSSSTAMTSATLAEAWARNASSILRAVSCSSSEPALAEYFTGGGGVPSPDSVRPRHLAS